MKLSISSAIKKLIEKHSKITTYFGGKIEPKDFLWKFPLNSVKKLHSQDGQLI